MAGSDKTARQASPAGPVVILVQPQLGENIGMTARAMLNFGLRDLRLAGPRRQWLSDKTRKASAGADEVLDAAQVFDSPAAAIADLTFVLATSARARDMVKPVMTPSAAVARLREESAGGSVGILFGPERSGLDNDSVVLADALVRVPVNPGFGSLNLAQGVLLMAYEWFRAGDAGAPPGEHLPMPATRPATREELMGFYGQLEGALDESGFLHPPEKRPAMVRNIRNFFQRAQPTEQDIRTLRGIVSALKALRRPPGGRPREH